MSPPMRRIVLLLAILAGVTGCNTVVGLDRTRIGESFSVEPQIRWSSLYAGGNSLVWTVDGPALESLRLVKDVADGQPLLGTTITTPGPAGGKTPTDKQPRFRATMTPTEIMELVMDTWALLGALQMETSGLHPYKFGSVAGFRFDLTFVWPDGVEARALIAGGVVQRRLQLIVYEGTRLHYFDKHRPAVDRLMDSVRTESR